uniref:Uncharacterized protein n=1 Tax=Chenopodium quinoa TaxID=63459 RepID=A0A803N848_CHEQI
MTVGHQTVVQRLNTEAGPIVPNYQPLSTIPRTAKPDYRFDVVVVILYVEEQPHMIPNSRGRESPQIFLHMVAFMFASHEQSVAVLAWNDLAINDCNAFSNWAVRFIVVGLTALKAQSTTREKLFRIPSSEISSIKNTENLEAFAAIQEMLSTKPFLIKVGPTKELSKNNVLIWTLKSVKIEDEEPYTTVVPLSSKMDTDPKKIVSPDSTWEETFGNLVQYSLCCIPESSNKE